MPRGDRTGPFGAGPMTGRGAGYCAGFNSPGFMNMYGRGFGRGMGRGFGWNRGIRFGWGMGTPYYPSALPYNVENEANMLNEQIKNLETTLESMRSQLTKLEKQQKETEK